MRTSSKAPVALLAVVLAALALAGCGSAAKPKPQGVDGVTLTPADTKLAFGQSANVLGRSAAASSPLQISVASAKVVPVTTLATYGLAKMSPPVTPYFVYVDVKNVGTQDIGGTPIPLYLQDAKNVLINYSPIRPAYGACPSQALPKKFGAGATIKTCLIYLLPKDAPATVVSYRPIQTVGPITWSGTIVGQSPAAKPTK